MDLAAVQVIFSIIITANSFYSLLYSRPHSPYKQALYLNKIPSCSWGSEILPYLQANNLIWHSCMNDGRRQVAPGQRQRTLIFRIEASTLSINVFASVSHVLIPTQQSKQGICTQTWVHLGKKPSLGNSNLFTIGNNLIYPLAPEGETICIFQGCSTYKRPWRGSLEQRQSVPCLQDVKECDTYWEFFPNSMLPAQCSHFFNTL